MDAARTSETSVYIQLRTRQYIPEDSELHTPRSENLKSHIFLMFVQLFNYWRKLQAATVAQLSSFLLQDAMHCLNRGVNNFVRTHRSLSVRK
jgi:hypothetical protein